MRAKLNGVGLLLQTIYVGIAVMTVTEYLLVNKSTVSLKTFLKSMDNTVSLHDRGGAAFLIELMGLQFLGGRVTLPDVASF